MNNEIQNPKPEIRLGSDERLAPPATAIAEPYITKTQIAERLRKSLSTVSTWMRKGLLPYYKIRKSVLFKWSEVEKHLPLTHRAHQRTKSAQG